MFSKTILFSLILFSLDAYSWDFGFKGSGQYSSSDNVNLSQTKISDTYRTLDLAAQVKNEKFKFKLKGKVEKYKNETANDFYNTDFNIQYKRTKLNDYNLGVFKLVYNNIPAISSDTSSNNSGARLSTNFNQVYSKKASSFVSFTGTYKNYPILSRKDKILTALVGYEYVVKKILTIAPDFTYTINSSNQVYYKNISYGPSLYLGLIPDDFWEHFISIAYAYTKYSGRTVSETVSGKVVQNQEHQKLITLEIGTLYNLTENLTLQAKYSTNKNTSNNSQSAYIAHLISASIGFRY